MMVKQYKVKLLRVACFVSLGSFVLSGCANMSHKGDVQTNPASLSPSHNLTGVKTKIIKEYVPVPLPGQLMPTASNLSGGVQGSGKPEKTFLTKEAAVAYANKHATVYPNQQDFFNAMATYSYVKGAMYVIYAKPLNITDVELQNKEKVISIASGDTLRWQVAQTYSGDGDNITPHLLIKPNKEGLSNTLVVMTNKHTYHLILKSTDEQNMVSVKWQYGGDMVKTYYTPSQLNVDADNNGEPDVVAGDQCPSIDPKKIDVNYSWKLIEGDRPTWVPEKVFSEGHNMYIKFPNKFIARNATMPTLAVQTDEGSDYASISNMRFECGYMILNEPFVSAKLYTGVKSKKNRTVILITHNQ